MTTDEPACLAPKLRFPEFGGRDLEVVTLGAVTAESRLRNRDGLSSTSVMGVRKEDGIVPMEGHLPASDLARYKVVSKGWFAYNPMRLNIGSIARWTGDSDILVSPDYMVFYCPPDVKPNALSPDYFDYFRRSSQWRAFVSEGWDGGVRVRVYYDDIAQLRLYLPDTAEQQKVADCLGSLDDLIAAENRKLEVLRRHKQGLMRELFPRDGETVPRLRFTEFAGEEEWKEELLDDLAKRGSGHTPNKANPGYWNEGVRWVSLVDSARLDDRLISETAKHISERGLKNSSAVLHPAGSVILSRDAGVGKSAVLGSPMAVSQHFISWTCEPKKLSNWFLYYHLQRLKPLLENIAMGSTIKTIGLPYFRTLHLPVPPVAEQQRIADCLSSLDDVIDSQARKLDALKEHKKGLIQQLFPSPEHVA